MNSEPILWSDALATGVAEIDEQHRILVNTLNDANARLTDSTGLDVFDQITRDLLSYALYHFETEEGMLKSSGYADANPEDAEIHLHQHRAFSAKVVAVRDQIKAGKRIARDDLLSFLNSWLIDHILNTDKRLGAFVTGKGKPPS